MNEKILYFIVNYREKSVFDKSVRHFSYSLTQHGGRIIKISHSGEILCLKQTYRNKIRSANDFKRRNNRFFCTWNPSAKEIRENHSIFEEWNYLVITSERIYLFKNDFFEKINISPKETETILPQMLIQNLNSNDLNDNRELFWDMGNVVAVFNKRRYFIEAMCEFVNTNGSLDKKMDNWRVATTKISKRNFYQRERIKKELDNLNLKNIIL